MIKRIFFNLDFIKYLLKLNNKYWMSNLDENLQGLVIGKLSEPPLQVNQITLRMSFDELILKS